VFFLCKKPYKHPIVFIYCLVILAFNNQSNKVWQ
jgi:hypothetical protein